MSDPSYYSKDSSVYRFQARQQLAGNWGKFALLYLIIGIATIGISAVPILGFAAEIALSGPTSLGIAFCMIKLFQDKTVLLEDGLEGFRSFFPAFLLYLMITLITLIWSFLFIIPGIVAAYSYSMSYYILLDNPGTSPSDVIRRSKEMMNGHRMDLFILHLTFIGWGLLTILTLGIGTLWLAPYVAASNTAFYLDLKAGEQQGPNDVSYQDTHQNNIIEF